ncbi:cleft lip and palate transmembrane protein 1-domain-containing protein [Xylaria bambusicola]|uniref:cleft lip and palate transmembrane protein 1-domain-containing protein n=1 Tax=Xylaria bambusicola TaxID=326684 RepID=UPI0020081BF0|nr:cleft lip and palate transmembrane protein 1-domain-containing protein [Xylaria bambusicola]KAI0517642.1 cleft lip and palate transmembrane protein 1-domain-containing protein [Xylaria bambusicola]
MPATDTAPAANGAAGEQGQASLFSKILQGVLIWFGIQMLMKQFIGGGNQPKITTAKDSDGNIVQIPANTGDIPAYQLRPATLDPGATYSRIPQRVAPIWPSDSAVDIVVTLSSSFVPTKIASVPEEMVALKETNFKIGNSSDKRSAETLFDVPTSVQNNGTLWGHFYFGLTGSILDPKEPGFDPATAVHFTYPLTQYLPKKKIAKTRNLLEDQPDVLEEPEEEETGPIVANYYHPNTSLSFIPDTGVLNFAQQPPAVQQFLVLESTGARDGSGQNSWYYPILFVNQFWQMKTHMILLNDTVKTLPMRLDLGNLKNWQFNLMATMDLNTKHQARQAAFGGSLPGGSDGSEVELIKEIFLDTNPWLLGVTIVVSIAHLILETLAFGSDIAHYRKKKDNVGISVRSILANVFMQSVIFLYLVDNSQNTSWMILGTQGIGIVIEFWKITTVVNVRMRPAPPGSFIPYRITFEDKYKLSETEEKTKEYDEIAFKYMYIAGVPLLIGYAIYSLYYESHKSWYSYIITTLVGSVYAYGFLMMVPSLYINYRLKSVAHMPGKAMMYKFLNTFIDDLFAFTIKMPFLHRLATLRDDVIFFIYLYQRWAYKVDYTRVNEFGQGGEDEPPRELKAEPKSLPKADPVVPETVGGEAKASGSNTGAAKKRK